MRSQAEDHIILIGPAIYGNCPGTSLAVHSLLLYTTHYQHNFAYPAFVAAPYNWYSSQSWQVSLSVRCYKSTGVCTDQQILLQHLILPTRQQLSSVSKDNLKSCEYMSMLQRHYQVWAGAEYANSEQALVGCLLPVGWQPGGRPDQVPGGALHPPTLLWVTKL